MGDDMSTDSNKQMVQRYFDAVAELDKAAIRACLTDEFVFQSMQRKPDWLRLRWNADQFASSPISMSSLMKKPLKFTAREMTAEGDRVCVEADSYGEMKNGKIYDNAYHFVFKFREGKITEVREYSCSYLADDVFGEFQPTASNPPL
jgi:ketosteroid isomerase-like protein